MWKFEFLYSFLENLLLEVNINQKSMFSSFSQDSFILWSSSGSLTPCCRVVALKAPPTLGNIIQPIVCSIWPLTTSSSLGNPDVYLRPFLLWAFFQIPHLLSSFSVLFGWFSTFLLWYAVGTCLDLFACFPSLKKGISKADFRWTHWNALQESCASTYEHCETSAYIHPEKYIWKEKYIGKNNNIKTWNFPYERILCLFTLQLNLHGTGRCVLWMYHHS